MSPLTEQLGNVEPGTPLGSITYNEGGRVYTDTYLNKGVVPESSDLGAEDTRVYVATDEAGQALAAIAFEHIRGGEAELIITSRDESARKNIDLMRGVIGGGMARNSLQLVHLSPDLSDMTADALHQVGFQSEENSDDLILAGR
jgi:hypothetical protein